MGQIVCIVADCWASGARKLDATARIWDEECTEIGCGVAHGFWKAGEGVGALLGGGRGVWVSVAASMISEKMRLSK